MIERTLALVKPDGVKRRIVGDIISRFQKGGLKIVAMKMVQASRELAEKHYPATEEQITGMGNKTINATKEKTGNLDEVVRLFGSENPKEIGKTLREWMIEFLTSGPVVAMILESDGAIQAARNLGGFTDPIRAEKGTIRGDLGEDSIYQANSEGRATKNLIHLSGSREEAKREINLWFREEEILS